ncbi:MAG: ferrous iron transport protein A [Chloroflexi bacterium]|nr:ferrous iron transport protein A [Chloroflexota bacterium]
MIANNISVRPLPTTTTPIEHKIVDALSGLSVGETAVVSHIAPTCRGAERRRFMDLGILPGTKIAAEMRSPSGDPTAYRIRGAVIALRTEQASHIKINRQEVPA